MPRYFTYYWTNQRWKARRAQSQGQPLRHIASTRFVRRGVAAGDHVYVVTVWHGELFLLGKLVVGALADAEAAAPWLGLPPEQLWAEADHILAAAATPMDFDRAVPAPITGKLRFVAAGPPKGLVFRAPGELDGQTLRSLRELTAESAARLDRMLPDLRTVDQDLLDALDRSWKY
jgi:hypothetical protein